MVINLKFKKMKFLFTLMVCFAVMTAKAQGELDQNSFFGDYKGTITTFINGSSTNRNVTFTLAKGETDGKVKLTLKGYGIGRYELLDFDFPNITLLKKDGKWILSQTSNAMVDVVSQPKQGSTTFTLLVKGPKDIEMMSDGNLAFDFILEWGTSIMIAQFMGNKSTVTGISLPQVQAESRRNGVYDLQGRRVERPKNGLYIVDGKKIYIR